jgi:outer membrane protein assembly factor BamB
MIVPQNSHDIFISYNRKDKSFVEFLVRSFELANLKCFQDVTGLKVFDKLDASLKTAILCSRWLVAIISPSYLQSYWCLFEAIEAIQGQDLEQRFLPIVVRYSQDDQFLDEQFVLKALQDLDEQMTIFETQMIRMKAFELSAKLDKLRFVRTNLPKVFRQLHERIYPEFALWDDQSARSTLKQVLSRLAPSAIVDVDRIPLNYERLAATPVVVPRLRELPSVLWSARVGCQAWKNSPLVVGNQVLVGSAGSRWNEPDSEDGIYCLDAETGSQSWFAPAPADANRLMVSKGKVVTGCDDGSVLAVSLRDGAPIWQVQLDSGIVGGPIKLSANIGGSIAYSPTQKLLDPFLVVTFEGTIYILDLSTGEVIQRLEIGRQVIGDVVFGTFGHRELLLVPCADGNLIFVEYSDISLKLTQLFEIELKYNDEYAVNGFSVASLGAQPLLADGMVLQGIARQTYYVDPPLVAIDASTGKICWTATRGEGNSERFGNLRASPVVIGRQVIFAAAYSRGLAAVSLDDGHLLWSIDLSQGMFEQWCGPVACGNSVYLGRHDGYLHKVNSSSHHREWSIFLGDRAHVGSAVSGEQDLPEFQAHSAWAAAGSSPILATPTLDRGRLYIGTHEGYLYCLANLGEDATVSSE